MMQKTTIYGNFFLLAALHTDVMATGNNSTIYGWFFEKPKTKNNGCNTRHGKETIYTPFAIIDKVKMMKAKKTNKAKSMKGLELPINMIVVIAIAVLVLVAVAALFSGWLTGGDRDSRRTADLQSACLNFKTIYNCKLSSMSSVSVSHQEPGDPPGKTYTLQQLCGFKNLNTPFECAQSCGCNLASP